MSLVRRLALLVGVMLPLVLALSIPVRAQQSTGNGLQISPTRTELQINPGERKSVSITVKNVTQADMLARVTLNDFESDGLSGDPKIIVDSTERTTSSLEPFLSGLTDVELKAGESKEVTLELDVPNDASPGAYYGAIRFTAGQSNDQGATDDRQVTLTASVASLVLVEVSGNITEQIQLRSTKVERQDGNGIKSGSFFTKPPTHLSIEIKNTGNSFSRPFGRVTIEKNGKEVYSYEINNKDPRGNILPGSVRSFRDEIKNVGQIGRYTATVNVSHGSGGEILTQKVSFWYVPLWLLIAILVLLFAIIGAGFTLYKKKFAKRKRG